MGRTSIFRGLFPLFLCGVIAIRANAESAQLIDWQTDYALAHQERVEQQRPMLVFLTMEGCAYCYKMVQTTYQNEVVAAQVRRAFVPTVINGTHDEELASEFQVRVYPTTYVVDPQNRIVDRIEGFIEPDEFLRRLTISQRRMAQVQRMETKAQRR